MKIAIAGTGYVGLSNRFETILEDVKDKVYTRDIFNSDS